MKSMAFTSRSQASATPVDKVIQMQNQGISNDQIINMLQREGFKSSEIFDALTQADIKKSIIQSDTVQMPGPENPSRFRPSGVTGTPPMPPPMQGGYDDQRTSVDRIEEIAEAIIDEKWDQLVESVNKIIDWKEKVDADITALKTKIDHVNDSFAQVQRSIMGKVDDYDKTMTEVGTDVKALTKVFQKILPGFMENVSELSRITDKMRPGGSVKEAKVLDRSDRVTKTERNAKSDEIFEDDTSIDDIE